jgi:hypothetical protein
LILFLLLICEQNPPNAKRKVFVAVLSLRRQRKRKKLILNNIFFGFNLQTQQTMKKKMQGSVLEVFLYLFILIPVFLLLTFTGAVQQNEKKGTRKT